MAAAAGSTTMALFSDTETSEDNTFAAGSVDLKIDWNESYNGVHLEEQPLTDNPGPIFQISDVKPGDQGEATISLHTYDNPAWVWMRLNVTADDDVSSTEPELAVDDPEDPDDRFDGELFDSLNFTVWYDDGDNVLEDDETVIQTGSTTPQEEVCQPGQNIDVGMVLDRSGSMSGDKISAAKDGSKTLVDTLNDSDRSSLVSFATSATLDQELTANKTAVKDAIDDLVASGQTDIEDGVVVSQDELLNGANARSGAAKVMVVLSDGQQNEPGDPVAAAQDAKDDGIRVITIALGSGADTETLRKMASSDSDAYIAPNASVLTDVFSDIGNTICEPVPQEETALTQGILLDADASTASPDAFVNSTTRYIGFKWELPQDTGNEVQTDMTQFDLDFYAEQERNNPTPTNPWN